ncbi:MAG: AAA family ATPase [SAR324 cluster bacterium]|nr:AAA family ATPase [SAR324 cluster bacterium]
MKIENYFIEKTVEKHGNKIMYLATKENQSFVLQAYNDSVIAEKEFINTNKLAGVHVIPFLEKMEFNGKTILVQECDEGAVPLDHFIKTTFSQEKIEIAQATLRALKTIHDKGILYNNLSLEETIINQEGQVRFSGFSSASKIDEDFIKTNSRILNPLYVSPERTNQVDYPVHQTSDYYSFGVLLYCLLVGKYPFESNSIAELISLHVAKQPISPNKENSQIPENLSRIVEKLLEKNSADRYKSIDGILYDLEHYTDSCFELASHDIDFRFKISDTVYGREKEIEQLKQGVEDTKAGKIALTTIAGYSGVGKSTIVSEFFRVREPDNSLLISGKFQQYKKDIPYFAIIEAFEELFDMLLLSKQITLDQFRKEFTKHIGDQGQILTSIFPKLELIVGKQKDVGKLLGEEAENRFKYIFLKLMNIVAIEEQPLILFLDDLQWTDLVSLNVLRTIFQNEKKYLMIVLSYRDNEVDQHHPFQQFLDEMTTAEVPIHKIHVKDLKPANVEDLVSDSLKDNNMSLSQIVYQKTHGNSFFVHQLLKGLADQGLFSWNSQKNAWSIDLEDLSSLQVSTNVVDFMQMRLQKFQNDILNILKIIGATGHNVDLNILSVVSGLSDEQVQEVLTLPVEDGLLYQKQHRVYFAHDRIQQACYQLNQPEELPHLHYTIANMLISHELYHTLDDIFNLTGHLDKGFEYIQENLEQYIEIYLLAALKSKEISAYKEFLIYIKKGMELLQTKLPEELCYRIYREYHIALYLNSMFDEADAFFEEKLIDYSNLLSLKENYFSKVSQDSMLGKYQKATEFGISILGRLGLDLNINTDFKELVEELNQVEAAFAEAGIHQISDLQKIEQKNIEEMEFICELILAMVPAAFFHNPMVASLLIFATLKLATKNGVFEAMGYPLSVASTPFIMIRNDYRTGYEYAEYAMQVAGNNKRSLGNAKHLFVLFCWHWLKPMKDDTALEIARDAHHLLMQGGDIQMAGFIFYNTIAYQWERGDQLSSVLQEVEKGLDFVNKTQNFHGLGPYSIYNQLVLTLQSKDGSVTRLSQKEFREEEFIERNEMNVMALCYFYIYKTQLAYMFGEYEAAYQFSLKSRKILPYITGFVPTQTCIFYGALSFCQALDQHEDNESILQQDLQQLKEWNEGTKENFLHKLYLLEAEIALVKRNLPQAIDFYTQAANAAQQNRFTHETALIYERFSEFWYSINNTDLGEYYIKQAYYYYEIWGAERKLETLKKKHPTTFLKSGRDNLDLLSVIHSQNILAQETRIDNLLRQMMQILLEVSGAEKGFLILKDQKWMIEAFKNIQGQENILESIGLSEELLSLDMVNYVIRTNQTINLEQFSRYLNDTYIKRSNPQSILVLPVTAQSQLIAIIYLEHSKIKNLFTPNKQQTIKLLSSQIAISLNNARVYNHLEELVHERTKELEAQNEQLAIARKKAEKANETKNKFFSIISHDLRGPIGSLSVIFNQTMESPKQIDEQLFGMIRKTTKNTHQLLEDLLVWSRQQEGRMELHPVNFSVTGIIDECISLHKGQALQKNITMIWDNSPSQLIYADPAMIQTVMRNLLSNALKFTPEGGKIRIETQVLEHMLKVSVIDSGVGIPEEICNKFFKLEERVASSPGTNQETGSGLGLILCHEFVNKNHGEIGVQSKIGVGSQFWFTIPLASSSDSEIAEETQTLPPGIFSFLLAEDNALHLRSSIHALEQLGASIQVAEDGEQALQKTEKIPFDIILMDIDMPKLNGIEAAKVIRKQNYQHAKIIALTSYSREEVDEKFGPTDFDGYLNKPLDPDKLLKVLSTLEYKSITQNIALPVHLPGIKIAKGLECVGEDQEFYVKLLQEFPLKYSHLVNELKSALKQEDFLSIQQAAHTLAGVAGSLGAETLHSISKTLENAAKTKKLIESKKILEDFEVHFTEVLQSTRSLSKPSPDSQKNVPCLTTYDKEKEVDADVLSLLFKHLNSFLDEGDLEGVTILAEIENELHETPYCQPLSQIKELLHDYEFEMAQKILTNLASELKIALEE